MESRNRTIPEWLLRVKTHQIVLPQFQRFEAWSHSQITEALNNVLHELPVGAVLVLEVAGKEPFISRPIKGSPDTGNPVNEHLLDGQQRITALWRSLHDNYEDRSYFVVVKKDEQDNDADLPYVESYSRSKKDGKCRPLWLNNADEVWQRGRIPLYLLRPDNEAAYGIWAESASKGDTSTELEIVKICGKLREKFAKFNIPFLSLPSTTPNHVALDVFIKMNTSSSRLTAYDITVAQVESREKISLHELVDNLRQEVPSVSFYMDPKDLVLPVAALLQNKLPNTKTYLSKDFHDNLMYVWDDTKKGIKKAVELLESELIFDGKRLPTDVVLYPLSALWARVPDLDEEGNARNILKQYIWRSFCTDRYEKSTSAMALEDYRQISKFLKNEKADNPDIFKKPLPEEQELESSGWPVRKDRLARAILAVSLRGGGIDFADGKKVSSKDDLAKREYHHIFPRAWLENKKHTNINLALNCALVGWKTNRKMSSKPPSEYIDERMERSRHGEEEIRSRLDSHLISFDKIQKENYEEFLSDRAERILSEMKKLCG